MPIYFPQPNGEYIRYSAHHSISSGRVKAEDTSAGIEGWKDAWEGSAQMTPSESARMEALARKLSRPQQTFRF